ncbi:hypothetical protein [Tropicibacter sp. S64]|uniref:hypothetical protein n=1 Tax=Tropicibacter sp. S64 TaxID=3415122 RepID=UPI003C7BD2FB
MSTLEMNGPDGRGGYLVALSDGATQGLIPADLLSEQTGGGAREDAEAWIAAESATIAGALETLRDGGTPRAPFDRIRLIGAET